MMRLREIQNPHGKPQGHNSVFVRATAHGNFSGFLFFLFSGVAGVRHVGSPRREGRAHSLPVPLETAERKAAAMVAGRSPSRCGE